LYIYIYVQLFRGGPKTGATPAGWFTDDLFHGKSIGKIFQTWMVYNEKSHLKWMITRGL
jgi:hypothetical protein